ncbi:glycosyltransferase [Natronobiforma cellulositropha]|uniref:glycosyltransferase n=1 Tax=Natronobiforma cellulositropha TaxID=1679076 RepID=UPI0021D5BD69|nr:glycosyltransferase [Natronobiforma cellulositropha]
MADLTVALLTPWNVAGGIATYARRFVDALETRGVDVRPVGITDRDASSPLAFRDLPSQVPAETDLVHVQFEAGLFGHLGVRGVGAPAFFRALARGPHPVVTTLHEVHRTHDHRGPVGDRILRVRDTILERFTLAASAATVVHTREAAAVLRERHGTGHHIERYLHPVEVDATPRGREEAKAALGLNGEVFLTFGWVERKKRYEDVIRVLPSFPDATYLIAGGPRPGEGEAVLESVFDVASDLGVRDRVRALGYVDDEAVPTVLSAADAVVLPYERVSQSGVVNDALAYRRPVVTTALPAFEELQTAYDCLRTYRTRAQLVGHLEATLSAPSPSPSLASAIDAYLEENSWGSFAERSVELYESVRTSADRP